MDTRYHFFLTVLMASVFIGYGIHDFSTENMSEFSRITDIDIAEDEVILKTSCFSIEITGSKALIDDLEKAAYQDELSHSLALLEANLRRDSELERLEISKERSGEPRTVLFLENGDTLEIESITALILAAENNMPIYVKKNFIRDTGHPTCMDKSMEI